MKRRCASPSTVKRAGALPFGNVVRSRLVVTAPSAATSTIPLVSGCIKVPNLRSEMFTIEMGSTTRTLEAPVTDMVSVDCACA